MSAIDLIMLVLLGLSLLVFVIQMIWGNGLYIFWLFIWAVAFILWVLLSPWPLQAVSG